MTAEEMTETIPRLPAESGMKKSVHSILVIVAGVLLLGLLTAIYLNAGYMADWVRHSTGLDYSIITVLQTAMLIVNLVTIPFCGALTLKFSGFKLFIFGYLLCIAGIFGMFLFSSVAGLIIFYVLLFGFGSAIAGYAIVLSVVLPLISEKFAGIAAATLISCGNCISLIFFPILQQFDSQNPGGQVFLILGVAGLCLLPLFFYIFSQKRKVTTASPAAAAAKKESVTLRSLAREIFTSRRFYLLCFLAVSLGIVCTEPNGILLDCMEIYFGLSANTASLYLSLFSLVFVISGIAMGYLVPKLKSKILYAAVCFLVIAAVFALFLVDIPFIMWLVVVLILGFMFGAVSPTFSLMTREWTGPVKFAAVFSIIYLMMRLGGIFGIFLGGIEYALTEELVITTLVTECILVVAAAAAVVAAVRETRRKKVDSSGPDT
ncbi:MAG: MFS transporter [Methanocorpusculum sp.]|nr:MFS transporter [Methanocorpusculum sp.]